MIIDAHTHFTTAPPQLQAYRGQQITNLGKPIPAKLSISDEELAKSMQGQPYLFNHLLPNIHFHVTTAYNILRHNGVEVGKKDFLGP